MTEKVLLLEPSYKNKYPPLGLMKISTYHKKRGDEVCFFKGESKSLLKKCWDRVYITTLFTFEWEATKRIIEFAKSVTDDYYNIFVGGITASLMPEEIKKETGISPITGKLDSNNKQAMDRIGYDKSYPIDNHTPDYDIISEVEYDYPLNDAYFAFMTRGCINDCEFCAVTTLEPEFEPHICIKNQIAEIRKKYGPKKDLVLMDNNVLASPKFNEIIEEIKELGFYKGAKLEITGDNNQKITKNRYVDFNQGLDAKLLTKEKAKLLGQIALRPARIAFDHIEDKNIYRDAIKKCADHGVKHFSNYMLYNSDEFRGKGENYDADSPEDLYNRLKITMDIQENINKSKSPENEIRIYSFPMKYIPLKSKDRKYIGPKWNKKYLRAIQVMLLPSQGVVTVSEEFFRKSFGENLEEFILNLKMPEKLLMSRGKFLKRDNENERDRKRRLEEDEEAKNKYLFYEEWKRLHNNIEIEEQFINLIRDKNFNPKRYLEIENATYKKIFLHYLSYSRFLSLLNHLKFNRKKDEMKFIKRYTTQEFEIYFKELISYMLEKDFPTTKVTGMISVYKEKGIKKIIEEWLNNYFPERRILNKLEKALINSTTTIDYSKITKIKALAVYIETGCINNSEEEEVKQAIIDLDEEKMMKILRDKFDEFKVQLKSNNEDEILFDRVEKKIEILSSELGEQLSLF